MITVLNQTVASKKKPWQIELSQAKLSLKELLDYCQLPMDNTFIDHNDFVIKATKNYLSCIQKGNPKDPLLLQILPTIEENKIIEGFSNDPLQEKSQNPQTSIVHKYNNRILVVATGSCAIHCRYCFRRHFPYEQNRHSTKQWLKTIDYLKAHPEVDELIFSGGDPLSLADSTLSLMINDLENILTIKTIRFHSRIPVVLPSRVDQDFLNIFKSCTKKLIMVIHSNHANELNSAVKQACLSLHEHNFTLLNQSVLLKTINDDSRVLIALSHRLFDCNVLPYYLHLLDKVQGAAHFDITIARAKQIYTQIQANLSGYLVPKLALEEPNESNKTIIM
ncbi:MAG: EF-P beta-lysylation protein EpmB [Saccharospirillaceae bacterium]|nr:EF-P beta-lysylation protein EpmB [Pseudomonadales bacterium]NRB78619.1 EF-P beta-lysylation protein EpmB [Saccharospirillaceae bacterium]